MREPLRNIGLVHAECLPPRPDAAKLASLQPGDFVQLIKARERFWCRILTIPGERALYAWSGRIDNDLLNTDDHGLENGDWISFRQDEVIQALKAGEQ